VIGSVVVVVAFIGLFVAGAMGKIGGPSDPKTHQVAADGSTDPSTSATDPSSPASPSAAPTDSTAIAPQHVKQAEKLKHTIAWLRRGLADETTFRVSTLNLLGDSHTTHHGNKHGYPSGVTRMGYAYSLLKAADIDVVGFQEMETPQYNRFRSLGGSLWDAYPGPSLDRGSVRVSIAWRTDTWKLIDAKSVAIPYFHGQLIRSPVVELENLTSHRNVWFFNTHNPASTHHWGNNAHWRAVAIGIEVSLANELSADGTPVVFLGDYNDREAAFCPLTGDTPLVAAAGGSNTGGCDLPSHPGIDWIFGSDVQFSGYVSTRAGVVPRTTDHPFVYAQGYIPQEPLGGDGPSGSPSTTTGPIDLSDVPSTATGE
jgi:hypothetical protein